MEAPKKLLGAITGDPQKFKGETKMKIDFKDRKVRVIILLSVLLISTLCFHTGYLLFSPTKTVVETVEVTRVVTQEVTKEIVVMATGLPVTSTPVPTNTLAATPTNTITPFPTVTAPPTSTATPTTVVGVLELNGGNTKIFWDKVIVGQMVNGGIWVMDRETFYKEGLDMPGVKAIYILIEGKIRRYRFDEGAWSFKPSNDGGIGYCIAADCSDQLTSKSATTTQQEILDLFLAMKTGEVRIGSSQYFGGVFWLRGNPAPEVEETSTPAG